MIMKKTVNLLAALALGIILTIPAYAADPPKDGAAAGKKPGKAKKMSFMLHRMEGPIPMDPWDSQWDEIDTQDPFTIPVTGQAAINPRLFTSSVKEMVVKGRHNDSQVAIMLEYKDPQMDTDFAGKTDAAAVMFPVEPLPKRAHLYMGEPMLQVEGTYVNIWYWKAKDNKAIDLKAEGIVNPPTPHESQDVKANGVYKNGKWRVVFVRNMQTADKDDSLFTPTKFANVSFATWDAKAKEEKSLHGVTAWYYLVPEAAPDNTIYMYGLMGFCIAGVLEIIVVKTIQKKQGEEGEA